MDENMNNEELTRAENMGNETEVQGQGETEKEQKLFTQEEVNSFVQSRISRIKGQISKDAKADYAQKLSELQAREMKLLVKEKLSDRGMSKELADIITCTDEEDLNNKLDLLNKIYGGTAAKEKEKPAGFIQIGAGGGGSGIAQGPDPIRTAMGLGGKE